MPKSDDKPAYIWTSYTASNGEVFTVDPKRDAVTNTYQGKTSILGFSHCRAWNAAKRASGMA
jgi:hypothetical protein